MLTYLGCCLALLVARRLGTLRLRTPPELPATVDAAQPL
jgi:hypothetical protein